MGDRKGVHPVVVGGIPVALLHHQTEPGGGKRAAHGPQALLLQQALQALSYPIPSLFSRFCESPLTGGSSHHYKSGPPLDILRGPSQSTGSNGCESRGQREAETGLLAHGAEGWGYTPGQCRAVNFVVIDEIHVLQHAQDGLDRAEGGIRETVSFKMHPTPLTLALLEASKMLES